MQLIVVVIGVIGTIAYIGELPNALQFPLPLVGGVFFTIVIVYSLVRA